MGGTSKVFISHAHADNAFCDPIHAWIRYWRVDCWYDRANMNHGSTLPQIISQAIKEHDTFLRICTVPAQQSFYVGLERDMFVGLMAEDHRRGRGGARKLINLLMDPNYSIEPIDYAFAFIDATAKPPAIWLEELRLALLGLSDVPAGASSALPLPPSAEVKPELTQTASSVRNLAVKEFADDDGGYLQWIAANPGGYVLNCGKVPRANYLMLHAAKCHTINPTSGKGTSWYGNTYNVWTGAYMKACSSNRADLVDWAQQKTGAKPRPCNFCKP